MLWCLICSVIDYLSLSKDAAGGPKPVQVNVLFTSFLLESRLFPGSLQKLGA